jgi:rubrerythrin
MGKMTEQSIQAALAGEAQAHLKYLAFAEVAEKEGRPNVARLFRCVAQAERIHAMDNLKVLSMVNETSENLAAARDGEEFESRDMYPAYMAIAQLEEEKKAQQSIKHAQGAEASHLELYDRAKEAVDAGGDIGDEPLQLCEFCGYVVAGDAPERCPVCQAPKKYFTAY